ncbi:Unknown protein, partial [Striga hermonthica]
LSLPFQSLRSDQFQMEQELSDRMIKIKLSDKEGDEVELLDTDIALGLHECQLSLIGKSYGEKRINFNGLKTTLSGIWITKEPFTIKNLGGNKFQFLFQNEEDKEKILNGKTWSFDGQYLLLKNWDPTNLDFQKEEEVIKIWVQIINLPLHWISADSGLKIGRKIGRVLDVLLPGAGNSNGQIMKILVELKLSEPLLRGTNIKQGSENRWLDFRYESIQGFCYYCGLIGHSDRNCSFKKKDILNNVLKVGQFGDWLRASSIIPFGHRNPSSNNSESQDDDQDVIKSPKTSFDKSVIGDKTSDQEVIREQSLSPNQQLVETHPVDSNTNLVSANISKEMYPPEREVQENQQLLDSHLIEVTVLPSSSENKSKIRQRKSYTRKPKSGALMISEAMVVDTEMDKFSIPNQKKRGLEDENSNVS